MPGHKFARNQSGETVETRWFHPAAPAYRRDGGVQDEVERLPGHVFVGGKLQFAVNIPAQLVGIPFTRKRVKRGTVVRSKMFPRLGIQFGPPAIVQGHDNPVWLTTDGFHDVYFRWP